MKSRWFAFSLGLTSLLVLAIGIIIVFNHVASCGFGHISESRGSSENLTGNWSINIQRSAKGDLFNLAVSSSGDYEYHRFSPTAERVQRNLSPLMISFATSTISEAGLDSMKNYYRCGALLESGTYIVSLTRGTDKLLIKAVGHSGPVKLYRLITKLQTMGVMINETNS